MPNPPKWYVIFIFADFSLIYHYFSRFQAFFTRSEAFGRSKDTREYRRGRLACLTLQNGMLFSFLVIFTDLWLFFAFSCVFHAFGSIWKPQRTQRIQVGWAGMPSPSKWYVISIFK